MSDQTKIEPLSNNRSNDQQPAVLTQRPSPLNGVALPRPPKRNRYAEKHGLYTLQRAVSQLGSRGIDGRSSVGVALRKWRHDLVADLGGEDAVSTQQNALIDLAVKSKLLLDSIDSWLLTRPTLVNKQKKALLPVVIQRQTLADALAKYLTMLGLHRVAKTLSLTEILAKDDMSANGNGADNTDKENNKQAQS